jgi:RHS repeat-associated protein
MYQVPQSPLTYLRSLNIDEPFIRQGTAGDSYFHQDAQWSTIGLTDNSGAITITYDYESYGKTSFVGTPSENPFQYTGRENDGADIYYFRSRYYKASLQRFLSEDPLGFTGGDWNLYGYVKQNPTAFLDPLGLRIEVVVWQPYGWGQSSFGHVTTNVNGTSYSFGPDGMTIEPVQDYISRNTEFRSGIGPVLDLSADQEAAVENCLRQPQGNYNPFTNNCGSPIQRCLGQIGFPVRGRTLPVDLGNDLLDSGRVKGIADYPGPGLWPWPAWKRHAPWSK